MPSFFSTFAFDRFFEKLFMAILFISQNFYLESAERKSPKKYFFGFCFDVWPGARILAYGDYGIAVLKKIMTKEENCCLI